MIDAPSAGPPFDPQSIPETVVLVRDRSRLRVSWRGGDESVESVLKQQADTIMVWGGEDSVRSYRNGLGLGTKLQLVPSQCSNNVI